MTFPATLPTTEPNMVSALGLTQNVPAFPMTSRYHGVETAIHTGPDGTKAAFLRRRFIPPPERFTLMQEHLVTEGERLDLITARYLGDPEQFWRVCDANNAMHPRALTGEVGRRLRITLPEGIPEPPGV